MLMPVSVIAPSTRVSSKPPNASVNPFSCSSTNQMLPASTRELIAFWMTSSGSNGTGVGVGLGGATAVGGGVGVGSGAFVHAIRIAAPNESTMNEKSAVKRKSRMNENPGVRQHHIVSQPMVSALMRILRQFRLTVLRFWS